MTTVPLTSAGRLPAEVGGRTPQSTPASGGAQRCVGGLAIDRYTSAPLRHVATVELHTKPHMLWQKVADPMEIGEWLPGAEAMQNVYQDHQATCAYIAESDWRSRGHLVVFRLVEQRDGTVQLTAYQYFEGTNPLATLVLRRRMNQALRRMRRVYGG